MIKSNRTVKLNLSFKGKQIGFHPGETKNLSHFFTPIEEYKLAKQFGLIYIPDPKSQNALNAEAKKIQEAISPEKVLEQVSKPIQEKKDVVEEIIKAKVVEIVDEEKKEFQQEQDEKVSSMHEVNIINDTFFEKEQGSDENKKKVILLEEDEAEEETTGKVFLEKPVAEKKVKKPSKKKAKKTKKPSKK